MDIVLNKGIVINNFDNQVQAIDAVYERWKEKQYVVVDYIYWSKYTLLNKAESYAEALKYADFILPDGIGMYIYVKTILKLKLNNLNGTDLNPEFLKYFDQKEIPVAFYGASQQSAEGAFMNTQKLNIPVYYYQNGFSELRWDNIKEKSVLMVGLGTPKQECWVKENIDMIKRKKLLLITVGGFFDFQSGKVTRAPKILRMLKLEWIWRMPTSGIRKNIPNFFILNHILKDFKKIKKLNK